MRETVPSLKFEESEALSKPNLKDKEGTTPLPLRENEKAATFVVTIKKSWYILLRGCYKEKLVYITKGIDNF